MPADTRRFRLRGWAAALEVGLVDSRRFEACQRFFAMIRGLTGAALAGDRSGETASEQTSLPVTSLYGESSQTSAASEYAAHAPKL